MPFVVQGKLMYLWIKYSHILLALASTSLHLWRLWRAWCNRPALQSHPRQLAHVIDSLLLASALMLVHLGMPWPLPAWLQIKLGLIALYVITGIIALQHAPLGLQRLSSLLAAACLPGILLMAIFKPVW